MTSKTLRRMVASPVLAVVLLVALFVAPANATTEAYATTQTGESFKLTTAPKELDRKVDVIASALDAIARDVSATKETISRVDERTARIPILETDVRNAHGRIDNVRNSLVGSIISILLAVMAWLGINRH